MLILILWVKQGDLYTVYNVKDNMSSEERKHTNQLFPKVCNDEFHKPINTFRVSARPLWLVGPDVPSAGRANYRHALIIPTCFKPRSDKPYQNNHQF